MSEEDWSYCQEALSQHSRSFALPISGLPPDLRVAVTCSYLLCRIADTVEDTPDWSPDEKERLQRSLLDVLDQESGPDEFVSAVSKIPGGDPAERELLLNLPRVLTCFSTCRESFRLPARTWISELIRGMCIYSRRRPGPDGIVCLESEADLDRYCYFVAGTIGRLLTEVFIEETQLSASEGLPLRERAERFAAGLQLVNILRDIPADLTRGHCFIPRTLLEREGIGPADLIRPECRTASLRALKKLFAAADSHLNAALEYAVALPRGAVGIRSFCAIPLWMAVGTLTLCSRDPLFLAANHRVKLSRPQVMDLVTRCVAAAPNDEAMHRGFLELRALAARDQGSKAASDSS